MSDLNKLIDDLAEHAWNDGVDGLKHQSERTIQAITALRTALAASPDAEARRHDAERWQPIETAPKDGTWILLWDANREVAVSGCWHTEASLFTPDAYEPGWSWWTADDDIFIWDGGDFPTHWMPLPNPPIDAAKEGKA